MLTFTICLLILVGGYFTYGCSLTSFFGYSPFTPYRPGNEKKQDSGAPMQILRGGQHLRVHGGNIPQRQYVRLPWTLPRTEQGRTEGLYRLPIERG